MTLAQSIMVEDQSPVVSNRPVDMEEFKICVFCLSSGPTALACLSKAEANSRLPARCSRKSGCVLLAENVSTRFRALANSRFVGGAVSQAAAAHRMLRTLCTLPRDVKARVS